MEKKQHVLFIPWPLSGLLLLSSRIIGQQPEFEYAADYVLRSGILPNTNVSLSDNTDTIVEYIRSIKPVVSFHDDKNEQGFRMTHLAMENTSKTMIEGALNAVNKENLPENLDKISEALHLSNKIFNCMWKVSDPDLYNKEVRIFIQGLYGNQGRIYDEKGLFFDQCGDTVPTIHWVMKNMIQRGAIFLICMDRQALIVLTTH